MYLDWSQAVVHYHERPVKGEAIEAKRTAMILRGMGVAYAPFG